MFNTVKRRKLRLPQLAKYNRRMRETAPRSEFVIMAHKIAMDEMMRRESRRFSLPAE